jgi:hypothetical protein
MKTAGPILIVIFTLFCLSLQAQTVSYKKLDSISAEISRLQFETNGLTYNDGITDYEISFTEANFQVAAGDRLATKTIYKKSNGSDLLYLTENIDLSKATGITNFLSGNRDLLGIKLCFPKGFLKTQVIKNGTVTATIYEDHLEFFKMRDNSNGVMKNYIYDLCTSLKKEKGLVTAQEIEEEIQDWQTLTPEEFIEKHPNSLVSLDAKFRINAKKGIEQKKYNAVLSYIDSLSQVYKFKPGLTEKEFRSYNPEASITIEAKNPSWISASEVLYQTKVRQSNVIGPRSMDIVDGIVTAYSLYSIVEKKDNTQTQYYFSELLDNLQQNLPAECISVGGYNNHTVEISHPKIKTKIKIVLNPYYPSSYAKTSEVAITFETKS